MDEGVLFSSTVLIEHTDKSCERDAF